MKCDQQLRHRILFGCLFHRSIQLSDLLLQINPASSAVPLAGVRSIPTTATLPAASSRHCSIASHSAALLDSAPDVATGSSPGPSSVPACADAGATVAHLAVPNSVSIAAETILLPISAATAPRRAVRIGVVPSRRTRSMHWRDSPENKLSSSLSIAFMIGASVAGPSDRLR